MSGAIPPAQFAASVAGFYESLTPHERAVLPYLADFWLRPNQRITPGRWHSWGQLGGRGLGKSTAIAPFVNKEVMSGRATSVALMAPTDDRVEEVPIKFLIETAPPHMRPERYKGGLIWPNGVRAETFTPEAPGRPRSGNYSLVWMVEIVDWNPNTRLEAFKNLTTACRVGRAQFVWDTTSKGVNEVILALLAAHGRDPVANRITRGTMLDNPALSEQYLREECAKYTGREFAEEVLGRTYTETAGAQFQQGWLDTYRVTPDEMPKLANTIVVIDPAQSTRAEADETGLARVSLGANGHVYFRDDESGHLAPEEWGDQAVRWCQQDAAGVLIERNKIGDLGIAVIRARAQNAGLRVKLITDAQRVFPKRTPGVVYVREVVAASSKYSRGSGPAAHTEAGKVHLVGTFPELERELVTYEPGTAKSPNRHDVFVYGVLELAGLMRDGHAPAPVAEAQAMAGMLSALAASAGQRTDVSTLAAMVRGGARRID